MGGRVSGIATAMKLLLDKGPQREYYPEPAKSIFIGQEEDTPRAKTVLAEFNFAHRDGMRYLGGFIGTEKTGSGSCGGLFAGAPGGDRG